MIMAGRVVLGIGIAAGAIALASGAFPIPIGMADAAQRMIGLDLYPAELGWMDGVVALSDDDRKRLQEISAQSHVDNIDAIRAIQGGERARLTRRDFELLRQDGRRAIVAYPDLPSESLFEPGWFNVSYRDRVPASFCTSGNFNSTSETAGSPVYLDGPCYMTTVNASYAERANGPTVMRKLAELRARKRSERMNDSTERGYHFAMAGAGGSLSVNCEAGGKCVVTRAAEWSTRGTRWTFDYVPSEWAGDPTKFESFPSFRHATSKEVDVKPVGTTSEGHVGTAGDRPDAHGTVSPVPPPPPVPQRSR
jgi:hypothetical protein